MFSLADPSLPGGSVTMEEHERQARAPVMAVLRRESPHRRRRCGGVNVTS